MRLTFHRLIFWSHLIAGLLVGVIILSMAVSGLLIAYETQLMDWASRDLRVAVPADGSRLGIEALVAKARAENLSPSGVTWKADPALPVTLSIGREGTYYFNPYTGQNLGSGAENWHHFFHAATDWHRFLTQTGLERPVGKAITGAGTLLFGFLLVSGIYLWWPRHWRAANLKAALLFNRKLKGRARDWNWHNVIGFWSSFPMLLIILTGLIMSYSWANTLLFKMTGNEPPPPRSGPPGAMAGGPGGPGGGGGEGRRGPGGGEGERRREGGGPGMGGAPGGERPAGPPVSVEGLDSLLAQVQERHPGWLSISLRMPQAPGGAFPLMLDKGGRGQPHLRTMLNLDLAKKEIQPSPDNFEQLNLGRRLRMYARFLHTGELFGFLGQTLAVLCTLSAILLVWTGFALAFRRFFKRQKAQ
ncbi:MAG: PepSY-associated TM helix domain-containing protein [Verrucomicrobiota bacterium]